MCLPDFEEFRNIDEQYPLFGYRNWRLRIRDGEFLISQLQDYRWESQIEGPHVVTEEDSGYYAYNYYNYYNNYYYYNNYNHYNNYYYNNNYYNYNYNNYYYKIGGIILQHGRVAIHETGYRSEYARIHTLFTIRESDARGPKKFIEWIEEFNQRIRKLAEFYGAVTVNWQDYEDEELENENQG